MSIGGPGTGNDLNSQSFLHNRMTQPNHTLEDGLLVYNGGEAYGKRVYLVNAQNTVFDIDISQKQHPDYTETIKRTKAIVASLTSRAASPVPSTSGLASVQPLAHSSRAQDKVVGEDGKAKLVKDNDIFSFLKKINAPHVLVNAANNKMKHSGGIAGAIARKAGAAITRECKAVIAKDAVSAGDVVWTSAHGLKSLYKTSAVAHAVGPNVNPASRHSPTPSMNQKRQRELLTQCYAQTVIDAGMKNAAQPVVFPPISAFNFGVDIELSVAAFKEGIKNAENTLQAMGAECPDVYLVLAEKYDSSSTIAKAEHAFSSSGTVGQ